MPLSTIFQLYHGGKFIGGRSQNKHEKTLEWLYYNEYGLKLLDLF
jgi:hypothetical protein